MLPGQTPGWGLTFTAAGDAKTNPFIGGWRFVLPKPMSVNAIAHAGSHLRSIAYVFSDDHCDHPPALIADAADAQVRHFPKYWSAKARRQHSLLTKNACWSENRLSAASGLCEADMTLAADRQLHI
jgi:hypothetical protein